MSSRRTLILIGALLVGGLAAFLTLNYVRGVENRVGEDSELVGVVVASAPVSQGTPATGAIQAKQITTAERPRKDVPSNAVRRLTDIEGQVAALDLGGGEVITTTMFGSTGDLTGSAGAGLDPGNVALTVAVDPTSVAGDLIKPGDLVNLMVTHKQVTAPEGEEGSDSAVGIDGSLVRLSAPAGYVFQAAKVFAVGTDAGTPVASEDGEAAPKGSEGIAFLTIQLSPEDAQLLASVRNSALYASLVPPDYEPHPIPVISELPGLPGSNGATPSSGENLSE